MSEQPREASWWRDVRVLLAIVGTVVGVFGLTINFTKFLGEQPNLKVTIEEFAVDRQRSADSDIAVLLGEIEARYGSITANKIIKLQERAEGIDFYAVDQKTKLAMEDLAEKILETIEFFDKQVTDEWGAQEIVLRGTRVIWPDGVEVDLARDARGGLFPRDLVSRITAKPNDVSAEDLDKLRTRAHTLYSGGVDPEKRRQVSEQLRQVRGTLNQLAEGRNRAVKVTLMVHNRSALPNYIMPRALLSVCRNKTTCVDMRLTAKAGTLVNNYSVVRGPEKLDH